MTGVVGVWNGIWHLIVEETPHGFQTVCGLLLRDIVRREDVELHDLKLCRWCGEDR